MSCLLIMFNFTVFYLIIIIIYTYHDNTMFIIYFIDF